MTKCLLIGAVVVGGVFVGFVGYKVVKKKGPKLLATTKKKVLDVGKRTSQIVGEAKQAFAEGFAGAASQSYCAKDSIAPSYAPKRIQGSDKTVTQGVVF